LKGLTRLPPKNDDPEPEWREGAGSRAAVFSFFVLTFTWAWGLGFLAMQAKVWSAPLGTALMIAAGFGPSLSGLLVVRVFSSGKGLQDWLARCLKWRLPWAWYVGAFLAPPALMLCALALHRAWGGAMPSSSVIEHIPMAIANFALVLLVGGPLGEEFGWRGYAMPALTGWMRWRTASLIIGVVWGLWHLPLFYQTGSAQSQMPILIFMVNILAGSVVFGWLFERTEGSVLPSILLHTSLNAWAGILAIIPSAVTGRPYALVTGLLAAVALGFLLCSDPKSDTERPLA
jgi:membrane protease YdiL (CAAX protease family)